MKNNEYIAYTSEATKIKKKGIWRSFGIGSVVWLGLVALSSGSN